MQRIIWSHSIAVQHKCANRFCGKTNLPKLQNIPNTPDFWLASKIYHNNLCLFIIISVLLFLLHLLSLHNSLVYPPFVCILYDECSEDETEEYSSAKYQWRKWGGKLGAIARPSIEKLLCLKGYKNELIRLVLPHFNFWLEKCYDVFISTGCQNNS